MEIKKQRYYFSTRDLILMALLGAIGGSFILTTKPLCALMPVQFPGLCGLIFIPINTIFLLCARGLVGKFGAATFTDFAGGFVSFMLPGGPSILLLFPLSGFVIDVFLSLIRHEVDDSRIISTVSGFIPHVFSTFYMYWGFSIVLGKPLPFIPFIAVFMGLHGIVGALGGFFAYHILKRVRAKYHG